MMLRKEYPRPQFYRKEWINLNGQWQFDFDDKNIGVKEKWFSNEKNLEKKIQVPFAYQTKNSGINEQGFHDIVWYKKCVELSDLWKNKRIILHFGAVDYRCEVYINEKFVGKHEGGHTSFSIDITEALNWKKEIITLRVEDPSEDETIPRGKQYWLEKSESIWYTRTTGIWQTVWIEAIDEIAINSVKYKSIIELGDILIDFDLTEKSIEKNLLVEIKFKDKLLIKECIYISSNKFSRSFNLFKNKIFNGNFHGVEKTWLWSPENPNLFDINLKLIEDNIIYDEIYSYFGMRKVHTENGMVYLNNKPYYQKLVLDQGYWRNGLLTAPDDEDFKLDIQLAKQMGFNGCRKHQKVEDPRFLYWADKLGFIVWGECASFISYDDNAVERLTKEWLEIIKRDYNHPSILTWVPLNESWGIPQVRDNSRQQAFSMAMYYLIHSLDDTRLVISNDGWELTHSDICAVHNYNHGNKDERKKYKAFEDSIISKINVLNSMPAQRNIYANGYEHRGEPILLTEFGGIGYNVDGAGWGYTSVNNEKDFINDYKRVLQAVYKSEILYGFCYTQLTDVEQEINGLLTYDRKPKCDLKQIYLINNMWHENHIKKDN